MSWVSVFAVVNSIALAAWVTLVLLPRKPFLLALVLYGGVMMLALIYALGVVGSVAGILPGTGTEDGAASAASFTTIAGIRAIFASDGGVVIGWTHYLALDLFTGLWIARDADHKAFSRWVQAPILLLTFMAGPLGLLLWLIIREARARKQGRPS